MAFQAQHLHDADLGGGTASPSPRAAATELSAEIAPSHHRNAAAALAETARSDLRQIARHCELAGDVESARAAMYGVQLVDRIRGRIAHLEGRE